MKRILAAILTAVFSLSLIAVNAAETDAQTAMEENKKSVLAAVEKMALCRISRGGGFKYI